MRLMKCLDGKLTSDERDDMVKVFEALHDEGMKAASEIARLKNKVNRLCADNRELRSQLSESREHRGVLGEVGRLFGV